MADHYLLGTQESKGIIEFSFLCCETMATVYSKLAGSPNQKCAHATVAIEAHLCTNSEYYPKPYEKEMVRSHREIPCTNITASNIVFVWLLRP